MKYAVLGSMGQLGRDLCARLAGEVVALTRPQADLTNADSLQATLHSLRPDVVVNCAAYNQVDRAESEPAAAFAVNAWGVRELARICRDLRCELVHFSTDYVFGLDAERSGPYTESDAPGPLGIYGLSKLAGEYLVRSQCPPHYVIRTCGLYGVWGSGGKGGNFVETMIRLARDGKPIRVVADQHCTPTYTADLAAATADLIRTGRHGLYHLTNGGSCSWFEFARAIFQLSGLQANLSAITSQEYGAAARRPAYSILSLDKLASLGLPMPRPWQQALQAYLQERASGARGTPLATG
jgi:dTDP-4-dehydrorhamnose reductase